MQAIRKYQCGLVLLILIANCCQSQELRPKAQRKIDSLYPNAQIIGWNGEQAVIRDILLNCNCPEFDSDMQLTIDTNGNILMKTYYFWSMKGLPKHILDYIKSNSNQTVTFDTTNYEKHLDHKKKISYELRMRDNNVWYEIQLNKSGKILSKSKEIIMKE